MQLKEIHKIGATGHRVGQETIRKFEYLKRFSYIGIFLGSIMAINDFFTEHWLSFQLITVFVLLLIINLLQVKLFKQYEIGFLLAVLSFATLIIALVLYGEGSMFVWVGPFIIVTFFMMGSRVGTYIATPIFIFISVLILLNIIGSMKLPFPMDFEQLAPDLVASWIALLLFTLIFQETVENKEKTITNTLEKIEAEYDKDETILNLLDIGFITTNQDGIIKFINKSGVRLLGRTKQETMGKFIEEVLQLEKGGEKIPAKDNPINQPAGEEPIKIALDDDINIKRSTGESFPAGINIMSIGEGEETEVVIAFSDLSKDKEINKFKDAFLTSMQHQLSTPLSIIKWNTELSKESAEGLKKIGFTKNDVLLEIQQATERIMDIQNKILTYSKIKHNILPKETEDIDPVEITKKSIKHLYLNAKRKTVLLNLDYDKKLRKINANKELLSIIIDNLISNAIKYSNNDSSVDIYIKQEENSVIFKIIDHGIGIPNEEQEYVFNKFFRSSNAKSKFYDGSGLGLYTSKILISNMGGDIWFESKEGVGTTFYIKIPNKS